MKELVFEITHVNYSLMGPGTWDNINYKIYNDFSVEKLTSYYNSDDSEIKSLTINEDDYKSLLDLMEVINRQYEHVEALDGDAWKFVYYKNNVVYKKRKIGYIYGIEPLEKIQTIIEKIG